jgi:hypothetical protein
MGEVKGRWHGTESHEPVITVGLGNGASREALTGRHDRAVGRVADSESSGQWIEPTSGARVWTPVPFIGMDSVNPPPRTTGGGCP